MEESSTLDALVSADQFVRPSDLSPAQWETLESEMGAVFQPDYRDLALRYDLTTVEVAFTRFSPPGALSSEEGLLEALRSAYNPEDFPFARLYQTRQVVPVGSDYAERYFMLALDQTSARYPKGTLWLFDPLGPGAPNPDTPEASAPAFTPVSSSFSQALHMAYLANALYRGVGGMAKLDGDPTTPAWQANLFERLAAIDPAIRRHAYWREWIAAMVG